MALRVLVLGAGITGVTSAWHLARAGHDVTVVDRQPGAGLETSFANGGQISVSHPEPWANPRAPATVMRWLGREDAPLKFRPQASLAQWTWGLQFLLECLPGRTRRNTAAIASLALYSRVQLQALRAETGIEYDCLGGGILHLFFDRKEASQTSARAEMLHRLGIEARVLGADECLALEPALRHARTPPLAGLHAPLDESGDAYLFTDRLARRCADAGVAFLHGTRIVGWDTDGRRMRGVRVIDPQGAASTLHADAVVVCLGTEGALLLAQIGERLPIYPVKGYSVTLPIADPERAPRISLTDESRRVVCSRLGERLRIAGTAELTGYDLSMNSARAGAIRRWAEEMFPGAGDSDRAEYWAGLRPATPSNVPIIGRGRFANLYYNTGHGTLGWTLSCGSARAIADIVGGRHPEVDFPFRTPY